MPRDEAQGHPAYPTPDNRHPSAVPGPQYEYKALADLVELFVPGLYNFYAVVMDCSVPRPTQRGESKHLHKSQRHHCKALQPLVHPHSVLQMADAAYVDADWLSSMKVADPTTAQHRAFQDSVDISFFSPRPGDLPGPDCVGQLIRLHRCKVRQGSCRLMRCGMCHSVWELAQRIFL